MKHSTFAVTLLSLVAVLFGWCGGALGQIPITDLHNTGVGVGPGFTGGGALPDDAIDPHYTLAFDGDPAVGPLAVVATSGGGFPVPPWLGDSATSAWTTPSASTEASNSFSLFYSYTTTFTTPGAGTVTIAGMASVDNFLVAAIIDGGAPLSIVDVGGFDAFHPFTIVSPVAAGGSHTLAFRVQNGTPMEVFPVGPTGLRVEFDSAVYVVPEPSSLALACLGLMLLGWIGQRRRPGRVASWPASAPHAESSPSLTWNRCITR